MTPKNIQDVVAEKVSLIVEMKVHGDTELEEDVEAILTQLVKEVEAGERERWLSVSCGECDGTGARNCHSEYDALKGMVPCHECDGTGYAFDAPPPKDLTPPTSDEALQDNK